MSEPSPVLGDSGAAPRYAMNDHSPNNATIRRYGIWDMETDDYAVLDGEMAYGLTGDEADEFMRRLAEGQR